MGSAFATTPLSASVPFAHYFLPGWLFGDFVVLRLDGRGTHTCDYRVRPLRYHDSTANISYAARVYKAESLSPSDRKYRARSIKRLASRTVWKGTVEGFQVIVYKEGPVAQSGGQTLDTDPNKNSDESLAADMATLELDNDSTEDAQTAKDVPASKEPNEPKQKGAKDVKRPSVQQQESRRLRQRDRRRAKRDQASSSQMDSPPTRFQSAYRDLLEIGFHLDDGYRSFTKYIYQNNPSFTARVPTRGQPLQVQDKEEIVHDTSLFVDTKDREVIFLQRQSQKLQATIRKLETGLVSLSKEEDSINNAFIEHSSKLAQLTHCQLTQEATRSKISRLQSMQKALKGRLLMAKGLANLLRDRANTERQEWTTQAAFFGEAHNKVLLMDRYIHSAVMLVPGRTHFESSFRFLEDEFHRSFSVEKDRLTSELAKVPAKSDIDPISGEMKANSLRGYLTLLEMFHAVKTAEIDSMAQKLRDAHDEWDSGFYALFAPQTDSSPTE